MNNPTPPFSFLIEDTTGLHSGVSLDEELLASIAISLKRIADKMADHTQKDCFADEVLPLQIGQDYGARGIYAGTRKDKGKTYNVFGYKEDIRNVTQLEGVKKIAELRSNKWIMPHKDMLLNNLYANKDVGAFKGTFVTDSGSGNAHWYWSCMEHRGSSDHVYNVAFTDGDGVWTHNGNCSLSCRPCRIEEVSE